MCQSRAQGGRRCAAHTAAGSLATTVAANVTSLNRTQVASLLTVLRTEAVGANAPVSGSLVVEALTPHLPAARRGMGEAAFAANVGRTAEATEEQIPACVAYAGMRLVSAAQRAERSIARIVEAHASRTGRTVEQAQAIYQSALTEARPAHNRDMAAPPEWTEQFIATHPRMTRDRATLYALHTLDTTGRAENCGTCGQFADAGHSCPPRDSAEERSATAARAHLNDPNDPAEVRAAAERGALVGHRLDFDWDGGDRLYTSGHANFSSPPLDEVRTLLDEHPAVSLAISAQAVEAEQSHSVWLTSVTGRVTVTEDPNVDGVYRVTAVRATTATNRDGALRCQCDTYARTYHCEHVDAVIADITREINGPIALWSGQDLTQRTALADATDDVGAFLAEDRANSVAAQQAAIAGRAEPEVSYTDDMAAFQSAYRAAKTRAANGEAAVPYLTENATGGLGAPDGGREFGVELEFDFPEEWTYDQRYTARRAIGADLYAAGLTATSAMGDYHEAASNGYSRVHARGWSYEMDTTVAGEIVSPIMHDTPETWRNLATVCDIVRRHGGVASVSAGSHVHVGVANYNHTVENHNRLVSTFAEYQDVLYRLSANPERGTHRGPEWCAPNRAPATGYSSVTDARHANYGHEIGLNLQSVTGRHSDHVEFRTWDASLDPAVIQSQIKVSLAVAESAFRDTDRTPGEPETLGAHRRARFSEHGAGRRNLTGEAWQADTASFRRFVDQMFTRTADKEQITSLFAVTRWQRSRGRS